MSSFSRVTCLNLRPCVRLLTCLSLTVLLQACGEKAAEPPVAAPVTLVEVGVLLLEAKPFSYSIQSLGRLVSAEKIQIGVEVAGKVDRVYFREGQRVMAGETLLTLDSAKQQLRLKRASANVAGAEAELKQAQQSYQRFASLGDKGAVSKDELNRMESTFANAEARLAQFRAEKKLVEQELRDLSVVSPVDGLIEAESVEPGQKVRPGDQLGVLQSRGSLQAVTFVNEAEVNQIAVGSEASLWMEATGTQKHQALVESIALTANAQTGNFEVKLRVANPLGRLREGMSASVTLRLQDDSPALVIPRESVVDRHRKRLVYVLVNGRAEAREPRLGLSLNDGWAVLSGLEAGEQLIISGVEHVYDGALVTAE